MSRIVPFNIDHRKATSKKETLLYGRVTKNKTGEKARSINEKLSETIPTQKSSFQSAFLHSGIGMAILNADGQFLEVNNTLCQITGYNHDELLKYTLMDIGHPDDNANDEKLLNRLLNNVLNHYSFEKRYISRQNSIVWTHHTVSKVATKDEGQAIYILQLIDITRRKKLNDELNRQNSELEAVRTDLISRINKLEELNHIIAHNLRGPANNIAMLVEMLHDKQEKQDESGLRLDNDEIINYLKESSSSLVNNLNTLMEAVQVSMNRNIPFDDCDVYAIAQEILEQLNSVIFESAAFVQLDLSVPIIRYPKVFLESIIYNLLSNALKYISKERIPEILLRTYEEDGRIKISVKDNGLGIDLVKYGNKIFKLNQTFHSHENSRGVGLYITKAQVESFGGNIQVKSRENEGSEFIVTL